jgi:hypothetical protein
VLYRSAITRALIDYLARDSTVTGRKRGFASRRSEGSPGAPGLPAQPCAARHRAATGASDLVFRTARSSEGTRGTWAGLGVGGRWRNGSIGAVSEAIVLNANDPSTRPMWTLPWPAPSLNG